MSLNPNIKTLRSQMQGLSEGALTIPNLLSLIRIIVIPFFVWAFLRGKYIAAVIIIFLSGITDLFDGKIARHFNQISKLGKLLDPAADKLTQIALTVTFFLHFNKSDDKTLKIFSYVFLLFCLKELMMIICSFVLLSMDIVPTAAIIYGKVATFTFYIVMGLLLLFAPDFGALSFLWEMPHVLIIALVCISATLTIVAFFSYIPSTKAQIRARSEANNSPEIEEQTK